MITKKGETMYTKKETITLIFVFLFLLLVLTNKGVI
tara:strand:+ start:127 stop:234 length:108 start_codon:yes stop_codon:yes gene_type:complete